MNEIATSSTSAKAATDRTVRHGLIEDWRDAVGILFLLLVAAFSGALIARYWPDSDDDNTHIATDLGARVALMEQRLSKSKSAPDVAALQDRVAKLETRLGNTELALSAGGLAGTAAAQGTTPLGQPAGPGLGSALGQLGPSGPDATRKLVDDLGTRLAALEGKTASTPADIQAAKDALASLSTKLDSLGSRLVRIENSDLLTLAHRASHATAVANLMRAAQGSSPFKTEFDAVVALLPGEPELAAIAPHAEHGLPTTGTLIATFGNTADAAMDAERVAAGADWWSRLWAHFMSLISTRAVGETTGTSTESRLARAELRLKAGDLTAAVNELNTITGAARGPLAPWLSQADARVKLETTLAALNTRAVAALAGPASTDDPANPVPQMPTP